MRCPRSTLRDGHHRSAAAARVAAARGGSQCDGAHGYFLSVIFPHHEMTILDYNRVVRDLNGRTPEQLLAEIDGALRSHASSSPVRPAEAPEFGMFLGRRWYRSEAQPRARAARTTRSAACRSRCSTAT